VIRCVWVCPGQSAFSGSARGGGVGAASSPIRCGRVQSDDVVMTWDGSRHRVSSEALTWRWEWRPLAERDPSGGWRADTEGGPGRPVGWLAVSAGALSLAGANGYGLPLPAITERAPPQEARRKPDQRTLWATRHRPTKSCFRVTPASH
jgi:hypothetical protein